MLLTITTPIADLRKEPKHLEPKDFSHNPARLSQLEFGEIVTLLKKEGEWLFIQADEQLCYSNGTWHGYEGWIHESEASLATKKRSFSPSFSRELLINTALSFLGAPYLWGGKAPFSQNPIGSVDCSGLSYLAYRSQGILIPRDAHDQYLKSTKIEKHELKQGDLIFWTPLDKQRVTHVILFQDKHTFIEAPETGKKVRKLPLPPDFWTPQENYSFPERDKKYKIACGRLL